MQHILNIAFDFDDEKVRTIAEKKIEQNMDSIVKEIILDHIAPERYNLYRGQTDRNWEVFNRQVNDRIDTILEEHKQEIIELAAVKLADSFKRTKVWKEKASEALE